MGMLILTVESFVGLYISQWDNRMNETRKVWLPRFVLVFFDPLGETGYYTIDRVKTEKNELLSKTMNKQGVSHWMLNKEYWYTDKRFK